MTFRLQISGDFFGFGEQCFAGNEHLSEGLLYWFDIRSGGELRSVSRQFHAVGDGRVGRVRGGKRVLSVCHSFLGGLEHFCFDSQQRQFVVVGGCIEFCCETVKVRKMNRGKSDDLGCGVHFVKYFDGIVQVLVADSFGPMLNLEDMRNDGFKLRPAEGFLVLSGLKKAAKSCGTEASRDPDKTANDDWHQRYERLPRGDGLGRGGWGHVGWLSVNAVSMG